MRRCLPLALLVALLAVLLTADAAAGAPMRSRPSLSAAARSGSVHKSRAAGPSVDAFDSLVANATVYSVCVSSSPQPAPAVAPLPSVLPQPVVDAETARVPLEVRRGLDRSCAAWGFFSDETEEIGWSYLSVESSAAHSDLLQSRAAGLLEGYLTAQRIWENQVALMPGFYPGPGQLPSAGVLHFLNETVSFNLAMFAQLGATDSYWSGVGSLYMQLQGLFEGYTLGNSDPAQALSWFVLYSLQLDVDIGDITTAVGLHSPLATVEERARAQAQLAARALGPTDTHCSALVKLAPGNADLFVGHDTWSNYFTMFRTFKLYTLPLRSAVGAARVHMSSYPGFLFSSDDWYQLSPSLLTVTETTNDLYGAASYALVQPASVALWARTLLANRGARTGAEWAELVARYNSGTCDNQWMIVDHKLFTPGAAALSPGLLTVSEQVPGAFVTRDMTPHLQGQSYWSSFNIPALTFALSGSAACQSPLGGYVCSYYENFRYKLFAALQGGVDGLAAMKRVLMYNEWQTDSLQKDAGFAIAAREDLRPAKGDASGGSASGSASGPRAFGGIDGKITADSWMKEGNLRVTAVAGPTTQTQAPFCWSGQWADQWPKGQPRCFDFPWVNFDAKATGEAQRRADKGSEPDHGRVRIALE